MALNKQLIKHVITITLIFTILDYVVHYFGFLVPELEYLLPHYFLYKILFLPIILYILTDYLKLRGYFVYFLSAAILGIRYYISGIYTPQVNVQLFFVHFVLLCISVYLDKKYFQSWYA